MSRKTLARGLSGRETAGTTGAEQPPPPRIFANAPIEVDFSPIRRARPSFIGPPWHIAVVPPHSDQGNAASVARKVPHMGARRTCRCSGRGVGNTAPEAPTGHGGTQAPWSPSGTRRQRAPRPGLGPTTARAFKYTKSMTKSKFDDDPNVALALESRGPPLAHVEHRFVRIGDDRVGQMLRQSVATCAKCLALLAIRPGSLEIVFG